MKAPKTIALPSLKDNQVIPNNFKTRRIAIRANNHAALLHPAGDLTLNEFDEEAEVQRMKDFQDKESETLSETFEVDKTTLENKDDIDEKRRLLARAWISIRTSVLSDDSEKEDALTGGN